MANLEAVRKPHFEQEPPYIEPLRKTQEAPAWCVLLGRVFISTIFILASFSHFSSGTIAYAAERGIPAAGVLVPLAGIIALVGGLSVLLGFRARIGAWLLVAFLVPVTLTMHNFWTETDPATATLQRVMFLKNLSMLGGVLLLTYFGAGPFSIDARRRRF